METFVLINNLQLHCPIGVMEQEQVIGNDFCINLRIGYDFTRAMTSDDVGDTLNFIKENMTANIAFFNGSPISVEAPNFVELEITFCEPGVKGDTATGGSKPATLETGRKRPLRYFDNAARRGICGHIARCCDETTDR